MTISDLVKGFQTTAETITSDFLEAYDVLLHLKDSVDNDEFNKCFDKASELYYVVTGFKIQLQECIDDLTKNIEVENFKAAFNTVKGMFSSAQANFRVLLLDLKKGTLY